MRFPRLAFGAAALAASLAPNPSHASPFSPLAVDPQIAAVVAQISPDSLLAHLVTLQAFQTRHTNSDTTSQTIGIGAARRWVHAKFTEVGNATGNVDVSYHDFTANIGGGGLRLHRNVVADIPGTAPPSERRIIVLGAHLDTRQENVNNANPPQYGVDDDGTGIACLLECARVLAVSPSPHTVRFIAFTGEEQGLDGSARYAAEARIGEFPIMAMIQNDIMASIIGAPDPDSTVFSDTTLVRAFASEPEEGPHRQLQRYVKSMADLYVPIQNVVLIPAEDRPNRGSDHISFAGNGFPAMRLMEYLEELFRQHTALGDTLGDHLSMSYLARNCQIDVSTIENIARAPLPCTGLAVGDVGDSTAFRLTWPAHPDEGSITRYLVTIRTPGAVDYESVVDAGLAHEIVLAPTSGPTVFFGLSAEDAAGRRALIAAEVLGTLSSVPSTPQSLVALPDGDSVELAWTENAESDLDGYHVYRSDTPDSSYVLITPTPVPTAQFDDTTAPPHTFVYYVVTAVDSKAKESGLSNEAEARLVTLDSAILFIEETRSGSTAWFPPENDADAVYTAMLAGLPHAVWDVDSLGIPTLSDLGIYSSVIWVSDDFNGAFNGFPSIVQLLSFGEDALAAYMDRGGNVMVAGWEVSRGLVPIEDYPLDLGPGDFFYDRFGIGQVDLKQTPAFTDGPGESFFPDLTLEPTRLNPNWNGKLARVEYITEVAAGAEIAYRFNSADPDSAYHQEPCATMRDSGTSRAIYWGFPLFHFTTLEAKAALEAAMTWFGELASSESGEPAGAVLDFALSQNRPNPFTGETEIRFAVPADGAKVRLSIYDVAGRRVRTLVDGKVDAGVHQVKWDAKDEGGLKVAAGVYFTRLEAPGRTLVKKITSLR